MKKTITVTVELNEKYGFATEHAFVDALEDTKSAIDSLLYGKMLWTGGDSSGLDSLLYGKMLWTGGDSSRLPITSYTITTD